MLTSPTTTNPTTITTAFVIAEKKSTEISEEKYFRNCFRAAGNCFWVSSCNFVPAAAARSEGVIMQVFNTGSADPGAALVRGTADTSNRAVGGDSLFVRVRFSREIMPPNEYH